MSTIRPKANITKQAITSSRSRKRKADELFDHMESQPASSIDPDDNIVKLAKQLAADSLRFQEQKKKEQQTAFSGKMINLRTRIPDIFDNEQRKSAIRNTLSHLREQLQRKQEIEENLTRMTMELENLTRNARRSLSCATGYMLEKLNQVERDMKEE